MRSIIDRIDRGQVKMFVEFSPQFFSLLVSALRLREVITKQKLQASLWFIVVERAANRYSRVKQSQTLFACRKLHHFIFFCFIILIVVMFDFISFIFMFL